MVQLVLALVAVVSLVAVTIPALEEIRRRKARREVILRRLQLS